MKSRYSATVRLAEQSGFGSNNHPGDPYAQKEFESANPTIAAEQKKGFAHSEIMGDIVGNDIFTGNDLLLLNII